MEIKEKYLNNEIALVNGEENYGISISDSNAPVKDNSYLKGNTLGGFANAIAENGANAVANLTNPICQSVNAYQVRKTVENRDDDLTVSEFVKTAAAIEDPERIKAIAEGAYNLKYGKEIEKTNRYKEKQKTKRENCVTKEQSRIIRSGDKVQKEQIVQAAKTDRVKAVAAAAADIQRSRSDAAVNTAKEVSSIIRSNGSGFKQQ